MKKLRTPFCTNHELKKHQDRHTKLETELATLSGTLLTRIRNDARIQEIKREKLACKDTIAVLKAQLTPHIVPTVAAPRHQRYTGAGALAIQAG